MRERWQFAARAAGADIARQLEEQVGITSEELCPRYGHTRTLFGRCVRNGLFPFHDCAFQEAHTENVGRDHRAMPNTRCLIGAFR